MSTPEWIIKEKVKITLDARPLLAQGIHPLERVMQEASALLPGEIYEIITPFPPAPMIEKMAAAGFETHTEAGEDGMFHTFFFYAPPLPKIPQMARCCFYIADPAFCRLRNLPEPPPGLFFN